MLPDEPYGERYREEQPRESQCPEDAAKLSDTRLRLPAGLFFLVLSLLNGLSRKLANFNSDA